jgi:hypothetical protein
MQCGRQLPEHEQQVEMETRTGGLSVFALSLLGSLAVSFVLVFVFGLPIFFLAGFLPLIWFNRKKN